MPSRNPVPHIGVYIPEEVDFLRGVVRAVLWRSQLNRPQEAERIARSIFNAYSHGMQDRQILLRIGMLEASVAARQILAQRDLTAPSAPCVV
jgi:hypothetical protein